MTRLTVCALLFAASAVLVVQRADPVAAQDKKDKDKKDDTTKEQLKAAQADLQAAQKQIVALKQEVNQLNAAYKKLQTDTKKDDAADAATLKTVQQNLDGYRKAGLVHVVILKLKPDSPPAEVQSLIDETYSQLAKIKTVRGVWAGRPSAKGTPDVAAKDYTVALGFVFDDADGLKKYLDDPVHTKFVDKHLKKWETPVVYDFEPRKP